MSDSCGTVTQFRISAEKFTCSVTLGSIDLHTHTHLTRADNTHTHLLPSMELFSSDAYPEDDAVGAVTSLSVDSSFARRYDAEAERRVHQRWRSVAARVPLGQAHLLSLLDGARAALRFLGTQPAAAATAAPTPEAVVAHVMAERGWAAERGAAAGAALAAAAGGEPSTLASALEHDAMRRAVRATHLHIKKVAFTGGGVREAKKAAGGGAREPAVRGGGREGAGGEGSAVSAGRGAAAEALSAVATRSAAGSGVGSGPRAAVVAAVVAAPAVSAAAVPRDAPAPSLPRGRGAGRGRGLDHTGEPRFADMHPSWRESRRRTRRQSKLMTRGLREGAEGAEAGGQEVEQRDPEGGAAPRNSRMRFE